MNEPPTGLYRHYKGTEYLVQGYAVHSETGEKLVAYTDPVTGTMWVRPWEMFYEYIVVRGRPTPRFAKIASRRKLGRGAGT